MDNSEKSSIKFWSAVYAQYLNPVAVIEELPEYFPVDSRSRNLVLAKDDQPHEAVDILLSELIRTNVPDAYNRFLEAVKRQHPWLISIITGEMDSLPCGITKIQFQEYVNKLLSRLLPTLVEGIIATNISMHMRMKGFLNQEEGERVEAKANNSGNSAAVRTLLAILVRKPIEWLPAFKNTIREQNYSEAVRDVVSDIPDDIENISELSNSVNIRRQSSMPTGSGAIVHQTYTFVEQDEESTKASVDSDQSFSYEAYNIPPQECEVSLCHCDTSISESQCKRMLHEQSPSPADKTLFENLHGTAVPDADTPMFSPANNITPKFSPANNIIPKEAGYIPRGRVSAQNKSRPITRRVSRNAVIGENAIILADERLDIAWNIIQTRFPHILDSTDRKIAFIVPKLTRDYDCLKDIFASQQWSVAFYNKGEHSGIRELMLISQVIVIAAESFLGWLNKDSDVGKISEFDLLIFDQCLTSFKSASYKDMLLRCLSAKQARGRFIHTQVIGLASSLNVGRLSGQNQADEVVSELIALFDAKGGIEVHSSKPTKSKKNAVAKTTLNKSSQPRKSCGKIDEITDPLTYYFCQQIDGVVDLMYLLPMRQLKDLQSPRKLAKGSNSYIKWCNDLLNRVSEFKDSSLEYHITNCANFLRVFNVAFLIKMKCRSSDACHYLENNLNKLLPLRMGFKYETVEKRLTKIANEVNEKLQSLLVQDGTEDCKSLKQIHNEIISQYKRNASSQILIIVNDSAIVDYMQSWIQENVPTKVSEPQSKPVYKNKTSRLPSVTVCHCDEASKIKQFDLIIRYGYLTNKFPIQKNPKCQRVLDIESEIITADDKVKVSNILLMKRAIEKSQDAQMEDPTQYIRKIEVQQSRLLVRKAK